MIVCLNYPGDSNMQPKLKTIAIETHGYFAWPYNLAFSRWMVGTTFDHFLVIDIQNNL